MSEGSSTAPEPGADTGSGSNGGRVPEQPGPSDERAGSERPGGAQGSGTDVPSPRVPGPTTPTSGASASGTGTPPELRIGHEERAAALAALDEHFEKGRLDVTEFGDRSAVAGSAVVASELTHLFRDLPAPHPDLPGRTSEAPVADAAVAPRPDATPARHWGDTLRVVLPLLVVGGIVALVIFGHGEAFALFPFIFILAHRLGPRRHH